MAFSPAFTYFFSFDFIKRKILIFLFLIGFISVFLQLRFILSQRKKIRFRQVYDFMIYLYVEM